MRHIPSHLAALSCLVTLTLAAASTAQAGFYFEGLTVFTEAKCDQRKPGAAAKPVPGAEAIKIVPEQIDWAHASADASTLKGRKPFDDSVCGANSARLKEPGRARPVPRPERAQK